MIPIHLQFCNPNSSPSVSDWSQTHLGAMERGSPRSTRSGLDWSWNPMHVRDISILFGTPAGCGKCWILPEYRSGIYMLTLKLRVPPQVRYQNPLNPPQSHLLRRHLEPPTYRSTTTPPCQYQALWRPRPPSWPRPSAPLCNSAAPSPRRGSREEHRGVRFGMERRERMERRAHRMIGRIPNKDCLFFFSRCFTF